MSYYQKPLNTSKTEKKSSDEMASGNNNIEFTHLGKLAQQAEKSNPQKMLQFTASKAAQFSDNNSLAKFQSEADQIIQKVEYEKFDPETVTENTEVIHDGREIENTTPNAAPQEQEQKEKGVESEISLKPETIILGGNYS